MSMAYTAYDLHRISGGRLVLGLGSQIKAHIVRRYDMPWPRKLVRWVARIAKSRVTNAALIIRYTKNRGYSLI